MFWCKKGLHGITEGVPEDVMVWCPEHGCVAYYRDDINDDWIDDMRHMAGLPSLDYPEDDEEED